MINSMLFKLGVIEKNYVVYMVLLMCHLILDPLFFNFNINSFKKSN